MAVTVTDGFSAAAAARPGIPDRSDRSGPTLGACTAGLCFADAAIAVAVALASCALVGVLRVQPPSPDLLGPASWSAEVVVLAPVIVCLSMWQQRAYSREYLLGARPRLLVVAIGWAHAAGLLALAECAMRAALHGSPLFHSIGGTALSAAWLLLFLGIGLAATFTRQIGWIALRPRLLAQCPGERALVVGGGDSSAMVASRLRNSSFAGSEVVAMLPELDRAADAAVALVRQHAVRTVFVVLSDKDSGGVAPLLNKLAALPVSVRLVPDLSGLMGLGDTLSIEAGLPVLRVSDPPLTGAGSFFKRAEDIVLSVLLLLATAPVLLVAMLAIKLESRGPVLFRQPRFGFNNITISVFKFRTMYTHMEDRLATEQSCRNDPRITRVGGFLRRHSLDELPQLFNVLIGEMSLVGPRPHAPATAAGGLALDKAVENYAARHRVKPGMTGWAQVCGWRGNLDSVEKALRRVEHDLYYIENWSLLFDLKILFKTVALVMHDGHAF